ncbi:DUF2690 domain-containing protein [Actinoplanes sp. NPDC024001]|uniref:DUF2690 domain-containing protein n=1 Tax=Actinoplanes sp. NPDC024001 TaxID=3154598 RepID=UPI0033F3F11F
MISRWKYTAAAAAALLCVTLTPTAANADDYRYDGEWPDQAGCTNIRTLRERTLLTPAGSGQIGRLVARVQLRYSATCRTVWARVLYYGNEAPPWGRVERVNDGKAYLCDHTGWSDDLGAYYCLSPMLNDANMRSWVWGEAIMDRKRYSGQTEAA